MSKEFNRIVKEATHASRMREWEDLKKNTGRSDTTETTYEFDPERANGQEGWTIQHPTKDQDWLNVGQYMQNCIQNMKKGQPTIHYLAKDGVPYVAINLSRKGDNPMINEIKGHGNTEPNPKYADMIMHFVMDNEMHDSSTGLEYSYSEGHPLIHVPKETLASYLENPEKRVTPPQDAYMYVPHHCTAGIHHSSGLMIDDDRNPQKTYDNIKKWGLWASGSSHNQPDDTQVYFADNVYNSLDKFDYNKEKGTVGGSIWKITQPRAKRNLAPVGGYIDTILAHDTDEEISDWRVKPHTNLSGSHLDLAVPYRPITNEEHFYFTESPDGQTHAYLDDPGPNPHRTVEKTKFDHHVVPESFAWNWRVGQRALDNPHAEFADGYHTDYLRAANPDSIIHHNISEPDKVYIAAGEGNKRDSIIQTSHVYDKLDDATRVVREHPDVNEVWEMPLGSPNQIAPYGWSDFKPKKRIIDGPFKPSRGYAWELKNNQRNNQRLMRFDIDAHELNKVYDAENERRRAAKIGFGFRRTARMITAAANMGRRRREYEDAQAEHGPDKSEILHTFEDGWTIRKMKEPQDWKIEGQMMGNCIGGMYNGDARIRSVRDPEGIPYTSFTLDTHNGAPYVQEIKGRGNIEAKDEYQDKVLEFAGREGSDVHWLGQTVKNSLIKDHLSGGGNEGENYPSALYFHADHHYTANAGPREISTHERNANPEIDYEGIQNRGIQTDAYSYEGEEKNKEYFLGGFSVEEPEDAKLGASVWKITKPKTIQKLLTTRGRYIDKVLNQGTHPDSYDLKAGVVIPGKELERVHDYKKIPHEEGTMYVQEPLINQGLDTIKARAEDTGEAKLTSRATISTEDPGPNGYANTWKLDMSPEVFDQMSNHWHGAVGDRSLKIPQGGLTLKAEDVEGKLHHKAVDPERYYFLATKGYNRNDHHLITSHGYDNINDAKKISEKGQYREIWSIPATHELASSLKLSSIMRDGEFGVPGRDETYIWKHGNGILRLPIADMQQDYHEHGDEEGVAV